MKHQGRDPKEAIVEQELSSWFENEIVDDSLTGYLLTRVDLSTDRSHLTLWYLPPEGTEHGDSAENSTDAEVQEALAGHKWEAQGLVEEILRKRPEIRWREDRGAENKRRVENILEELREEQGKDG